MAQELATPVRAPNGDWVVHLGADIDVYNSWLGLDADAIIRHAERIDGLPIARLSDVAAYKRLLDRLKDRAHLKLLEPYLAAQL